MVRRNFHKVLVPYEHLNLQGCIEHVDHFKPNPGSWSAFRSSDYGYTRLKVHNASHLHLEQVSINEDGLVIDHIWVVKEKHEAYPPR